MIFDLKNPFARYRAIFAAHCQKPTVAFSAYLTQLYRPLTALTNTHVEFATSLVSFERVFEVLDIPVDVDDRPSAVPLAQCRGHIRFESVSFSYDADPDSAVALEDVGRFSKGGSSLAITKSGEHAKSYRSTSRQDDHEQRQILQAIDFEMQPRQLTALVGPSGAGKTTITYLVPRLYDPNEGCVRLDGHDLRDLQLASLSQHIGMVTHETYLFHDTIRANLLYAKPNATQEELEDACRAANIHAFIASLPDGYDTIVGERGHRLSGGEKQRVAIARVVLKDPRVLILDEATSHLDSESEALIQRALERVMVGRTSLVIAHRLSTILYADQILVIDQGRVVQRGTREALLVHGGLYRDLYERQLLIGGNGGPSLATLLARPGWACRSLGQKVCPGPFLPAVGREEGAGLKEEEGQSSSHTRRSQHPCGC